MTRGGHNYNLDAAKFIAALLVVAIHTSAYIFLDGRASFLNFFVYRGFLDIAVPLFFAISGFLIVNKNTDKMKQYTKKIALLFGFSTLLFILFRFAMNIITALMNGWNILESIKPTLQVFTVDNLVSGVLGWGHLWYLAASVIACLIIIFFLTKRYSVEKILTISIVIYLVSLSAMINLPPLTLAGGFPLALVCISLGMYAGKKTQLQVLSGKQYFQYFAYFLFAIGIFVVARWQDAPIMFNLLLVAAVYFLVLALSKQGKETKLSKLGKYSLWIYILHPIFIEVSHSILYPILGLGTVSSSPRIIAITFVMAVSLSIIASPFMEKVWAKLQRKYLNN